MISHSHISFIIRLILSLLASVTIIIICYFSLEILATSSLFTRSATCLAEHCFCEATTNHFLEQPINALSSFAFILLGVWAIFSRKTTNTPERRLRPYVGSTLIFIGISSFIYHATLSFLGQFLDIFAMYVFGTLLTLGALYRSGRLNFVRSAALFIATNILLAIVQYNFPEIRRALFALLLLPGLLLELSPAITNHKISSHHMRYILAGIGIMLTAYTIWTLDQITTLCDPHSLIQGHALWHIMTAVAGFLVIKHYEATSHPNK